MDHNTKKEQLTEEQSQGLRAVLDEQYDGQLSYLGMPLDGAILGVAERNNCDPVLVYSFAKLKELDSASGTTFKDGPAEAGEPIVRASIEQLRAQVAPDQPLRDLLADNIDSELLFIDPVELDAAIVGIATFKDQVSLVVYDRQQLIALYVALGGRGSRRVGVRQHRRRLRWRAHAYHHVSSPTSVNPLDVR
jgi:hypothetical protein